MDREHSILSLQDQSALSYTSPANDRSHNKSFSDIDSKLNNDSTQYDLVTKPGNHGTATITPVRKISSYNLPAYSPALPPMLTATLMPSSSPFASSPIYHARTGPSTTDLNLWPDFDQTFRSISSKYSQAHSPPFKNIYSTRAQCPLLSPLCTNTQDFAVEQHGILTPSPINIDEDVEPLTLTQSCSTISVQSSTDIHNQNIIRDLLTGSIPPEPLKTRMRRFFQRRRHVIDEDDNDDDAGTVLARSPASKVVEPEQRNTKKWIGHSVKRMRNTLRGRR